MPINRFLGTNGAGLIIQNSIAVTNTGDVLAVWAERTSSSNLPYANQGNVSGAWGTAISLSQVANLAADSDTGLPLRVNANGDGVLGWTEQPLPSNPPFQRRSRILRYTNGSGWSTNAIDLLFPVGPLFGQIISSDLQFLDDGAVGFTDLVDIGSPNASVHAYRQTGSNGPIAFGDFGSATSSNDVVIASDPLGFSYAISMLGFNFDLILSAAHINGASNLPGLQFSFSTDSIPKCLYGVGSNGPIYTRPNYAAKAGRFFVYSLTTTHPSTRFCFLKLVAWDLGSSERAPVSSTTPTTSGTYVLQPPVLAMDQMGNGVAVWQQWSGDILSPTVVPVSAQSTQGAAWASPQVIGSNGSAIGVSDQSVPIRFALSRTGQGVAAMVIFREGISYIATARYSVSSGWTDWTLAATAPIFSVPNVAINDAGDAFLIYAAQPCTRSGTNGPSGQCGDTQNVYVLRLQ